MIEEKKKNRAQNKSRQEVLMEPLYYETVCI